MMHQLGPASGGEQLYVFRSWHGRGTSCCSEISVKVAGN
jgi:hypothetical protein